MILKNPTNLKIGIIYLIYLLYNTQSNSPKTKIDITMDIFQEIYKLKHHAIETSNKDLYSIIKQLKKDKSYNYTSFVRVDPLLSNLRIDKIK